MFLIEDSNKTNDGKLRKVEEFKEVLGRLFGIKNVLFEHKKLELDEFWWRTDCCVKNVKKICWRL